MARKPIEEHEGSRRPIRAIYFNGKKDPVHTNAGRYPRTMILHAVDHLQLDSYGAKVAEIFDQDNGILHGVLRMYLVEGKPKIEILYKRDPKKFTLPERKPE